MIQHARQSTPARQRAAHVLRRAARTLLPTLAAALIALPAMPARALDWEVRTAPDQTAAQAAFTQALQQAHAEAARTEDEPANAGVRTRSTRPRTQEAQRLIVAVGPEAARTALEQGGEEPLLMAMLSRLDHESLRAAAALQGSNRRIGVLLREPSPADQLELIEAVLPGRRRIGVVVTASSEPMLRELQRAAESDGRGWSLQVEQASDPLALGTALRAVLPRSDALIVLADAIGNSQAATLALLHAAAAARVPVFGSSEGIVRSGALAATVSTPEQLAQQALGMGERLAASPAGAPTLVHSATPANVRINPNVARSLDLRLPSEQELNRRLATAGKGP